MSRRLVSLLLLALRPWCVLALRPWCMVALRPWCVLALRPWCMVALRPWCMVALLPGCVVAPLVRPRPVPRVTADVYERFRLQHAPDASPVARPAVMGSPEAALATSGDSAESSPSATLPLDLEQVVHSVERHFPLILAALEEFEIAAGKVQGASGAFDTKLISGNRFDVEGFYESDRYDVGFEQPTPWLGSVFSGGYRLGSGDFAVYDGKAKTNEDGEFRVGVLLPLLRGSRIDANRVAVWQARIDEQLAEPTVLARRLSATRRAAAAYWKWVARGEMMRIARGLLDLAQDREEQLGIAVEEGLLAQLNLVENRRLIVERQVNLVKAERDLQEAAILLSLFWRDEQGHPIVASSARLPGRFPVPRNPSQVIVPDDADLALSQRPEIRAAELQLARLELDLDLARNYRLADLDFGVFASRDLGQAVNDPDDKGPFEVEARILFEMPLQQRQARGSERELSGKIAKLEHELRFAKDQVLIEVQDIVSALRQGYERVTQAEENVRLARELESAERLSLQLGESDLFRVNLREQQSAVAASSLIDVLSEHFQALAAYRAAIGVPYDEVLAGLQVGDAPAP